MALKPANILRQDRPIVLLHNHHASFHSYYVDIEPLLLYLNLLIVNNTLQIAYSVLHYIKKKIVGEEPVKHRVTDKSIYVVSGLIALSWIAASVLLGVLKLGLAIRILIGLVPVSLLVYQIILGFRYARGQDEVQKRIILEGLALAFAIALPLIFLIGFIIKAGVNLPFGFMDSGYLMEVTLLIGYAIAYRRYQ